MERKPWNYRIGMMFHNELKLLDVENIITFNLDRSLCSDFFTTGLKSIHLGVTVVPSTQGGKKYKQ